MAPRLVNPPVFTPSQLVRNMTAGYNPVVIRHAAKILTPVDETFINRIYPTLTMERVPMRKVPFFVDAIGDFANYRHDDRRARVRDH